MIDLVLVQLPNPALSNPKMYPRLGILYLAAVATRAGYSVQILDMRDGKVPRSFPRAKFYGFSCTTPEITEAKAIAKWIPAKTIVGGAHPSLLPQDCVGQFDYIVRGEGEQALLEILNGSTPNGQIIHAPRIADLDAIPYPAWDLVKGCFSEELFPGERYGKAEKAATIIASRGCPFHCKFCGNIYRAPVVWRSVQNVIGEIKELISRGVKHFRFEDDCFTLIPEFDSFCHALKELDIRYKCHTRADLLNINQAILMKESGCEECGLGVESADPLVIKLVNKKETVEQQGQAILTLRKAGIRSKTYFIAGLPGETDETTCLNKLFFMKYKPDKWTLSTFTPYPGSDIYANPEQYDIVITQPDWTKWWNFSDGYNHVLKGQTQEQMWQRYQELYKWLCNGEWLNG